MADQNLHHQHGAEGDVRLVTGTFVNREHDEEHAGWRVRAGKRHDIDFLGPDEVRHFNLVPPFEGHVEGRAHDEEIDRAAGDIVRPGTPYPHRRTGTPGTPFHRLHHINPGDLPGLGDIRRLADHEDDLEIEFRYREQNDLLRGLLQRRGQILHELGYRAENQYLTDHLELDDRVYPTVEQADNLVYDQHMVQLSARLISDIQQQLTNNHAMAGNQNTLASILNSGIVVVLHGTADTWNMPDQQINVHLPIRQALVQVTIWRHDSIGRPVGQEQRPW